MDEISDWLCRRCRGKPGKNWWMSKHLLFDVDVPTLLRCYCVWQRATLIYYTDWTLNAKFAQTKFVLRGLNVCLFTGTTEREKKKSDCIVKKILFSSFIKQVEKQSDMGWGLFSVREKQTQDLVIIESEIMAWLLMLSYKYIHWWPGSYKERNPMTDEPVYKKPRLAFLCSWNHILLFFIRNRNFFWNQAVRKWYYSYQSNLCFNYIVNFNYNRTLEQPGSPLN